MQSAEIDWNDPIIFFYLINVDMTFILLGSLLNMEPREAFWCFKLAWVT